MYCDPHKYTVLITLISVSYKLQRFAVVSAVTIAGSVVSRWTTDRKVSALRGSNPLRVVLGTLQPCTLFCHVVLKCFTIGHLSDNTNAILSCLSNNFAGLLVDLGFNNSETVE